jgi:hypothetical protein
MPTPPPETVTRFYGNVDFALDVLKNRQIAFVHVSILNDPFDPYCFFETDFGESHPNLIRYVREKHPHDLGWFRAQVTALSWGQTVRELKTYLQKLRDFSFVLSTSSENGGVEPKDNLYMWGHYAQGHHGLAIEFDTQTLANSVIAHHETENRAPFGESSAWAQIEYTERFAPITAEQVFKFSKQEKLFQDRKISARRRTELDDYYDRMSIIKSTVWEREAEWRLMWTSTETKPPIYKCPIGADAIRRIFLGLNFPDSRIDEVVSASRVAFPNATILRAHKRHGDLALEFDVLR